MIQKTWWTIFIVCGLIFLGPELLILFSAGLFFLFIVLGIAVILKKITS